MHIHINDHPCPLEICIIMNFEMFPPDHRTSTNLKAPS